MNAGQGSNRKMPAAEIDVTITVVRELLESQHPDLANLALVEVANGWDNVMFRLGGDFMVRLPRRQAAAALIEHEQAWLPRLVDDLPLPIPAPLRIGASDHSFPWAWSILPWFDGQAYAQDPPRDTGAAAWRLGAFVAALHRPVENAPLNPYRGTPLAHHNERVRERVAELSHILDAVMVGDLWASLLTVPEWQGEPMLLHGDLHPLNALTYDGQLSAVIDFGDITSGDPAADYMSAWLFFNAEDRVGFRSALVAADAVNDEDTWQRGRACALSWCLAVLANSADHRTLRRISTVGLERVLNLT